MARNDVLDLGSWCILRMASADTLPLVASLNAVGITAWTPIERKTGRMPRTRKEYDKEFALMPSYAFGAVADLERLMHLSMLPNKEHPEFCIFRHYNAFPIISDTDLQGLRAEEARCDAVYDRHKRKTAKHPTFATGTAVSADSGGFEGLSGVAVDTQGQFTLVSFDGFHKPIKIASLLLVEGVPWE